MGCEPVPNARPGSTTTAIAFAGSSSQGGPTQSGPIQTGLWNSRHRSSQPGSIGCVETSAKQLPEARLSVGVRVDRQLALRLLEALRVQLEKSRLRLFQRLSRHRESDPP